MTDLSSIPPNERPEWLDVPEPTPPDDAGVTYEPLGAAQPSQPASPQASGSSGPTVRRSGGQQPASGWQQASHTSYSSSPGRQRQRQSHQHGWGWWGQKNREDWWIWAVGAFFVFGGWRIFTDLWTQNPFEWLAGNWWWMMFFGWWPLSALMRRFNLDWRMIGGAALVLFGLSALVPGGLTTPMMIGMALVGVGLLVIFRTRENAKDADPEIV